MSGEVARPVFVVTCGRSGSTLVRYLLDAHPDVVCPPEASLPALIGQLGRSWNIVVSSAAKEHVAAIPPDVLAEIRSAVQAIMLYSCVQAGKQLYCDKSLDSVQYLNAVHAVFPSARYILLYRHALDVVMSLLEASPFGFHAYGAAPYLRGSTENFVAPLLQYWNGHVQYALAWEEAAGDTEAACLRVRYEDLVANPYDTMEAVCTFLDLPLADDLLTTAFARPFEHGPADHKIEFTHEVSAASVGRGVRIPLEMIPEQIRESTNGHLTQLGYHTIQEFLASSSPLPGVPRAGHMPKEIVGDLLTCLHSGATAAVAMGIEAAVFKLDEDPDHQWLLKNGELLELAREVDVVSDLTVSGTAEGMWRWLIGGDNVGALLRARWIRYSSATLDTGQVYECLRRLTTLVNGRGGDTEKAIGTSSLPSTGEWLPQLGEGVTLSSGSDLLGQGLGPCR